MPLSLTVTQRLFIYFKRHGISIPPLPEVNWGRILKANKWSAVNLLGEKSITVVTRFHHLFLFSLLISLENVGLRLCQRHRVDYGLKRDEITTGLIRSPGKVRVFDFFSISLTSPFYSINMNQDLIFQGRVS